MILRTTFGFSTHLFGFLRIFAVLIAFRNFRSRFECVCGRSSNRKIGCLGYWLHDKHCYYKECYYQQGKFIYIRVVLSVTSCQKLCLILQYDNDRKDLNCFYISKIFEIKLVIQYFGLS